MSPPVTATEWTNVQTEDGRNLEVVIDGPPGGLPLIVHGGSPGGAVALPPISAAAARHGWRTITYSRPGYASSTPRPGRSVADAVEDVAAILLRVGSERCLVMGWSGGGPHALACAALLPDAVIATTVVASVAPYGADGLSWLAGMAPENVDEFDATLQGERVLTGFLEKPARIFANVTGHQVAEALGQLVSDADRSALTRDVAELLAESLRRGVSTGVAGWRDDDLAFAREWGFNLAAIRTPIAIWQGAQDRMVPVDHGRWLAANVSGARVHLEENHGHFLLFTCIERLMDELAELAGH
jgi:pimeloyl-ACP methyl ester carboxylesterase